MSRPTPPPLVGVKDSVYLDNVERIGNSPNNILIYHDVLPEEAAEAIRQYAMAQEYFSSPDYGDDQVHNSGGYVPEPGKEYEILDSLFEKFKSEAVKVYGVELDDVPEPILITKWGTGSSMGQHVDDWGRHHYHIAVLFYINDDYDGGEISFPEHDITIKPKANSVIMFPSNDNYLHQVLTVMSGTRYTSTNWFKFRGSTFEGAI